MVLSDDAQHDGLSLITEAKYGFTAREGVVGVSLLRSALVTEADDHPKIRATPDRPRHSDLGRHVIELALGRHAPDLPVTEQPAALADLLYTPCVPCGTTVSAGLAAITGTPSAVPSWAEPLEGGAWALRLHETLGRRGRATAAPAAGWNAVPADVYGKPHLTSADAAAARVEPYGLLSLRFARS